MKNLMTELHIMSQGSPIVTAPTGEAHYGMQSMVAAIMAGGAPWSWGGGTLTYTAIPGERIGNEWQLDDVPSCFQITPNTTGDEWVCCVYPDGQAVLLMCDELASAYLITGFEL